MHKFRKGVDFEAFERVMVEVRQRQPIRVLSYCVWNRDQQPFADRRSQGRGSQVSRAGRLGVEGHSGANSKWQPRTVTARTGRPFRYLPATLRGDHGPARNLEHEELQEVVEIELDGTGKLSSPAVIAAFEGWK